MVGTWYNSTAMAASPLIPVNGVMGAEVAVPSVIRVVISVQTKMTGTVHQQPSLDIVSS
jgi:hypothetical protein